MMRIKMAMIVALVMLLGCSEKKEPAASDKPSASEKRAGPSSGDRTNPKKNYTSEADFLKFDVAGFYAGMTRADAEQRLASEGWTDGKWSKSIEQFANQADAYPGHAIDTTSGVWFRGDESIALYQFQPVNGPRSIWGVTYKRSMAQPEDVEMWVQRLKDKYGVPLKENTRDLRSDLSYQMEITPAIEARGETAHYKLLPKLTAMVARNGIEIQYSNPIVMEAMLKERYSTIDDQAKKNAGAAKQGF